MTDSKASNSDSEDTPGEVTPSVVSTPAENPAPAIAEAKQSTAGSATGTIAVLLSLLALIGSGFTWYQTQVVNVQSESVLAIGVSEIGGQVSRLGDSIARVQVQQDNAVSQSALNNQLSQFAGKLESAVKSVTDRQDAIDESINKINDDMQKGVSSYLLDEVGQLLKMAIYSVTFADDVGSAIQALKLADNQLKNLGDPRYAQVRKQINQEIKLLSTVQQADIEAISATLTAISNIIPELPLANEPETAPATLKQTVPPQELSLRSELAKVWQDIKGLIQIRRVDEPPKPLLAPQQRYFLNQNLQLNLAKAEIALLQQRPEMFRQGLQSAIGWLNDYFDTDDQRVVDIVQQLQNLQQQDLESTLPSITGSYDALQSIKGS